jgi:hypothetical protein
MEQLLIRPLPLFRPGRGVKPPARRQGHLLIHREPSHAEPIRTKAGELHPLRRLTTVALDFTNGQACSLRRRWLKHSPIAANSQI